MPDNGCKACGSASPTRPRDLPEGLNSLRGESVYGTEDFFEPVYVKGRRQRFGAQLDWTPGPTGFKAEWMQSREDRHRAEPPQRRICPTSSAPAGMSSGTWFVTGQDKDDNINPRQPVFQGGIGAIELAARYEELEFGSAHQERHGVHQSARGSPA